jgi:hypothetical protein
MNGMNGIKTNDFAGIVELVRKIKTGQGPQGLSLAPK